MTRRAVASGPRHAVGREAAPRWRPARAGGRVRRAGAPLPAPAAPLLPAAGGQSRIDDVVQQTFVAAWQALRDGTEIRDVRAWLFRVAHNEAVSALRRTGYDYAELLDSGHPPR